MRKIIKLKESELYGIINKIISEQTNYVQARPLIKRGARGQEVKDLQQILLNMGYDLGPQGADGKFGPNTERAIRNFQKTQNLTQTGIIDQQTRNLLSLSPSGTLFGTPTGQKPTKPKPSKTTPTPVKPVPVKVTQPVDDKKTKKPKGKFSSQVNRQLDYMRKNGILSNDRFTILDDKNNQVHAFNPNYELYKTFYVITGQNVGDDLKTQTMSDWVKENWQDVGKKFFSSWWERTKNFATTGSVKQNTAFKDVADYVDSCYFGQEQWRIKNTPSGVYKRAGNVENFMNDWLATTFIAEDYGSRFITWETCGGKTIPFGFHGTKSTTRLANLPGGENFSKKLCRNRQMSFGCINFADNDVKDISSFITKGQITIWLPDASDNIVEIPSTCLTGAEKPISRYDEYRMSNRYYMDPGKI